MDRGVIEARLDRVFTDEEWVLLAPWLDDYDEMVDDSSLMQDQQLEWLREVCRRADIDPDGGE